MCLLCILTAYSGLSIALNICKNGFSWKESH